jgi:hypothetical protein
MMVLIATMFLLVVPAQSIQERGNEAAKPHKTDSTGTDAQRKEQVSSSSAKTESSQSEIDKPKLQHNQPEGGETAKPVHGIIDLINAISTAIIAAFTIAMAVFIYNQDRTAKLTNRAWIVADMESPLPYEADKTVRFACRLRNKGQTPAWIIDIGSRSAVFESEGQLPKIPQYDRAIQTEEATVMTPDASLPQWFWLSSERLRLVESGQLGYWVFGFIRYRDIFDEEHETRYCFFFKPALGGADPVTRDFYIGGPPKYNKVT